MPHASLDTMVNGNCQGAFPLVFQSKASPTRKATCCSLQELSLAVHGYDWLVVKAGFLAEHYSPESEVLNRKSQIQGPHSDSQVQSPQVTNSSPHSQIQGTNY